MYSFLYKFSYLKCYKLNEAAQVLHILYLNRYILESFICIIYFINTWNFSRNIITYIFVLLNYYRPPPVIVYNRLSVGAPASPATTPSRRHSAREKTDMWYEYGCV